jgi:aryl-alcohol dehydrogenase-like predicted oxidoreductase
MSTSQQVERSDSMQYGRSGRSGLKLPAVSLGLWQNFEGGFPNPLPAAKVPHSTRGWDRQ